MNNRFLRFRPSPSRRRSTPSSLRSGFAAAVLAGSAATTGFAVAAPPGDHDELVGLINQYRSASRTCNGQASIAGGPLAPSAKLAAVDATSGDALQRDLAQHAYLAAQVQLISITGPTNARQAMSFLERRYCDSISNPEHAEIGVARDGKRWRIVLARPLLSPDLPGPLAAGREMVRLANLARSEPRRCGKRQFDAAPPVRWDGALADIALTHSQDMASNRFFAHQGSDGTQVSDRASRADYRWRSIGENLAAGQGSAETAMAAWLASPNHCENIMNSGFSVMGVAYAINPDSESGIYWTQVFALPRKPSAGSASR